MDAVTYPREDVIRIIYTHVVALRIAHDNKPMALEFNVKWTPALHLLDSYGKRYKGSTGFLPPEEFIPWVILSIGRMHFDRNEHVNSIAMFDVLSTKYPESDAASEGLFFSAVTKYKLSGKADSLKEAYEHLRASYSSSIWSKKALPYRLL